RTFSEGHRSNTPAGEELVAHQVLYDRIDLVVFDDSAPQQVPDVRCERVDLALVSIESKREKFPIGDPKIAVEALLQERRLFLESRRERFVVPNLARETRTANLCIIHISLDLARRAGKGSQRSIRKRDRVPRIFPALVFETGFFVAPFVFDVSIAVAI